MTKGPTPSTTGQYENPSFLQSTWISTHPRAHNIDRLFIVNFLSLFLYHACISKITYKTYLVNNMDPIH